MDGSHSTIRSLTDGTREQMVRYTRLFRFSVRQILFCLILLLIARPFIEGSGRRLAETILFSLLLLSSLTAVGAKRSELLLSLALILPALTFRWLTHFLPIGQLDPLPLIGLALALGFTIWQLLRFVARAARVDLDVLCAGISVYLLMGQLWSLFYMLTDHFVPGSFLFPSLTGHPPSLGTDDAIYFSMCTLTTAGYGDIIPISAHARSLATLESAAGVLYLAVLISRLVAMHVADKVSSAGRK